VPQRGRLPVGTGPLEQLMVRFDSYRAVSLGNRASRNLVKKSTVGGRATWQAVMRMKLEQASKATMWEPTQHMSGEGRADRENPGAGARQRDNHRVPIRTTGVVSTACEEGSLRQWGRPGMVGESQTSNGICRMADHLGVGKGQKYQGSRVTPVEGRALTSGELEKEERSGDWR
jgi:hypothetical protein